MILSSLSSLKTVCLMPLKGIGAQFNVGNLFSVCRANKTVNLIAY